MANEKKAAPTPAAQKPKTNKTKTVASPAAQSVGLFPAEVLYSLKLGSVKVPVIEEGKGTWREITQGQWNLKYQRLLIGYWEDEKKENPKFDIEAKMQKLFILPEKSEAVSSSSAEAEVEVELLPDNENDLKPDAAVE